MSTKKAGRRGPGTWIDHSPPGDRELIARGKQLELAALEAEIEARAAARRHYLRMQTWVLIGIGTLTSMIIIMLAVGLWLNTINSTAATELARSTLPILLGATATIVGAFFGAGVNINPNSPKGRRGFRIRLRKRTRRR
jgi:hypothetical protein